MGEESQRLHPHGGAGDKYRQRLREKFIEEKSKEVGREEEEEEARSSLPLLKSCSKEREREREWVELIS